MVLYDFLFFDENSTQTDSNEWKIFGRSNEAIIQIEGTNIDVSVEGIVDIYSDYSNIAVISMDDFSIKSKIEKAGLYLIPTSCVQSIKLINNGVAGSVRAYGLAKG